MPDLIESTLPLKTDFVVSMPHSLLATAGLMCAVPRFEGLGDWLREGRAQLPADLRDELCLLITFPGGYHRFTAELIACLPIDAPQMDWDQLLAHLRAIPAEDYRQIALRALARGATPPPKPGEVTNLLDRPAEWAAYLAEIETEVAPETVAALLHDGMTLKGRVIEALSRFWDDVYAQEFQATRPLMERSVAHHQAQAHSPVFRDVFTAVTGRLVPQGIAELLPAITQVTFIPSCYVGPYVAYTYHAEKLILYYNCRSTPAGPAIADSAALYAPLKALADETRLQILNLLRDQELYAQEIVDRLDISQPAVSRHLNLMAASGVLRMRREGNTKYYAIDRETLARVADALRTFA
jgi:DNA-binding transcriptional ArsR family regulator